jgi:hypothetical protein
MTKSNNNFDYLVDDDNCDYLDAVARVFDAFILQGHKQVVFSFSGGGDSGAIDAGIVINKEFFKADSSAIPSELYDIKSLLINNNISFSHVDINLDGILDKKYHNRLNDVGRFEDFLYNKCLLNISFDGDCYSQGIILIDLLSKTIITMASQEMKTWKPIDPMTTKIDSAYFSSIVDNSSTFDEL